MQRMLLGSALAALAFLWLGAAPGCGPLPLEFAAPSAGQLSLASAPLVFELALPEGAGLPQLTLSLDGGPVSVSDLALAGRGPARPSAGATAARTGRPPAR